MNAKAQEIIEKLGRRGINVKECFSCKYMEEARDLFVDDRGRGAFIGATLGEANIPPEKVLEALEVTRSVATERRRMSVMEAMFVGLQNLSHKDNGGCISVERLVMKLTEEPSSQPTAGPQ